MTRAEEEREPESIGAGVGMGQRGESGCCVGILKREKKGWKVRESRVGCCDQNESVLFIAEVEQTLGLPQ